MVVLLEVENYYSDRFDNGNNKGMEVAEAVEVAEADKTAIWGVFDDYNTFINKPLQEDANYDNL